ncbi:MAG: GNAT family N-acetyltransferase [Candidatus Atribacteria bacterium]|nr:MAG: GNAT family N-acetyltransferase [Candidatus Atribacteria bacterium]
MTIRALRLPSDLMPLEDMLIRTFQYPENPEWSIQADEEEDISREIKTLRRLWPLVRLAQVFSKSTRDLMRGFVWEEDGQIGAVVMYQRRGSTNTWTVGTVGVLPEFRRRGLARKLLTRSLDDIRARGGTHVVLGVIDRNVPAYALYKSLGFEHYSSQPEFSLTPTAAATKTSLPAAVEESAHDRFDWEKRYDLARRITPSEITKYDPVIPGRFKPPAILRVVDPLQDKMQKRTEKRSLFTKAGTIVGHSGFLTSATPTGTSSIWAQVDPNESELAAYALATALASARSLSPTKRVRFATSSWMPNLCQAAEDLGFTKRLEYHMLGLLL